MIKKITFFLWITIAACITKTNAQEYLPMFSEDIISLESKINSIVSRYSFDLKYEDDSYVNTTVRIEIDSLNHYNFAFTKPLDPELINRLIRIGANEISKHKTKDSLIRFAEFSINLKVIHRTVVIEKIKDTWNCKDCDSLENIAINEDSKKNVFEYSGNKGQKHKYRLTNTTFNGVRSIRTTYYGVYSRK